MNVWAVGKKYRATFIVVAVVLVVAGTMLTVAMAQPGPQQQQGADNNDGQRGRDFRAMMPRGGDSVALAVSGDSVFLFARNTLYKFDADTLEIVAQTELPRPERPNRDQQGQQ